MRTEKDIEYFTNWYNMAGKYMRENSELSGSRTNAENTDAIIMNYTALSALVSYCVGDDKSSFFTGVPEKEDG